MTDDTRMAVPPTTKDLARAAGVSRATVDRVLNGREGVRPDTVDRVQRAASEMGFTRNLAAANLAKRRAYRFLFVLPQTGDLFLETLTDCIREAEAAFHGDRISVAMQRVDANDPHALAARLDALDTAAWDGVAVMAPRSPQLRDAVRRAADRGLAMLPFLSDLPAAGAPALVGIDNRAAGATAGLLMGRFIGQRPGTVAVLAETMTAQDSLDRRHGFDRLMAERFPHLRALPSLESYGAPDRIARILAATLDHHDDIRGLYVLASEARLPLEALARHRLPPGTVVIVHERTAATTAALADGRADAIITQDPGHLARSALRRMKAHCDGAEILPSQERIRTEI
ncbi:MAG: LacI family DNA-binding transcriptional regulator, partial [Pseudomonadota bacterium]